MQNQLQDSSKVLAYWYCVRVPIPKVKYQYSLLSTGTHFTTVIFFECVFTGEYRYPIPSIGTLSCRSAFNAGRKLPNGFIDDLIYQNGWKSIKRYKNKLLKLHQYQESYPRAKIQF
ncbi:hypothetical protein GQ457_01G023550 [Hibiscus cannabinus]